MPQNTFNNLENFGVIRGKINSNATDSESRLQTLEAIIQTLGSAAFTSSSDYVGVVPPLGTAAYQMSGNFVTKAEAGTAAYVNVNTLVSKTEAGTAAYQNANTFVTKAEAGTAAYANTTSFATAAQGAKADTAIQQANLTAININTGTGLAGGGSLTSNLSLSVTFANTSQFYGISSTTSVNPDTLYRAVEFKPITPSANVAIDFSSGINFSVVADRNILFTTPTNSKNGLSGILTITQDATGGRAITFANNFKFPEGVVELSVSPNTTDIISYTVTSTSPLTIFCTYATDIR